MNQPVTTRRAKARASRDRRHALHGDLRRSCGLLTGIDVEAIEDASVVATLDVVGAEPRPRHRCQARRARLLHGSRRRGSGWPRGHLDAARRGGRRRQHPEGNRDGAGGRARLRPGAPLASRWASGHRWTRPSVRQILDGRCRTRTRRPSEGCSRTRRQGSPCCCRCLPSAGSEPVAWSDDDETATAETEVIPVGLHTGPPGTRPGRGSGRSQRLRRIPEGASGAIVVRIEVFEGVVQCREARRVLKNYYPHDRSTPPWSCVGYRDELVQCIEGRGGAFRGTLDCRGTPERGLGCLPRFPSRRCRARARAAARAGRAGRARPPGPGSRGAARTQVLRSPPARAGQRLSRHPGRGG